MRLCSGDVAAGRHPGLKSEQVDNVARLQRQLPDLGFRKRRTDRSGLRIDKRSFRDNADGFRELPNFQLNVETQRRVDLEPNLACVDAKAWQLRFDPVGA